jgi:hypothetical protein
MTKKKGKWTGPRPMTKEEIADCVGFKRVYDLHNKGKRFGKDVTAEKLAAFAAPLGGAKNPSQWRNWLSCTKPIPVIDKLIIVLYFQHYTPQEIFPSWQFPTVTQLPPKHCVAILVYLLTTRRHVVMGNALLSMAQLYAASNLMRRARLLRSLKGLMPRGRIDPWQDQVR